MPDDGSVSAVENHKVVSHEQQNKELREMQMKMLSKEQQIELEAKLKELKLTSRQLADSAITTYFGKPAFYPYGNGNSDPVLVKDKFKTHNVNPHSGDNKPHYSQVHARAMMGKIVQQRGGSKLQTVKHPVDMVRQPIPPRVPEVRAIPLKQVEVRTSQKINPEKFSEVQARQLQILPPKFTDKHLHTKKKDQ